MEDHLRRQRGLEIAEPHAVAAAAGIAAVIGDGDDVTGVGLHGGRVAHIAVDLLCPAAAVTTVGIQRLAAVLHLHAILGSAIKLVIEGQNAAQDMGDRRGETNVALPIPLLFLSLTRIANFHPFSIACAKML